MTDLNAWWDALTDAERDLFLAHIDTSPLPAQVVDRALESGQPIAGAKWQDEVAYTFHWPSWVQEFLRAKASEAGPAGSESAT